MFNTTQKALVLGVLALMLCFIPLSALAADDMAELDVRLKNATLVIEEFANSPDKIAAQDLIRQCAAVAIFPSVYKGAFIVGAQYGQGVICSYDPKAKSFSAPAFFSIGGGSVGWQIGGQSIDLILVVMNERGLTSLLKGKGTLGADVSVAAGPVGREAQAQTDIRLQAEIYSYSRAKGLFAGISIKGGVIAPNNDANRLFYNEGLFAQEILLDRRAQPKGPAVDLVKALEKFTR